jgi:hypothetical protein
VSELRVIPMYDEKPHVESVACPCRPVRDAECNRIVVLNAWDRREELESIMDRAP